MMKTKTYNIYLGNQIVGHLTHYQEGKNLFSFSDDYIQLGPSRPTLSLAFNELDNEIATLKNLNQAYASHQNLPTFFSNLLPEGGLKEYIITQLHVHDSNEFALLEHLKNDLPGNINLQISSHNQQHKISLKTEKNLSTQNNVTLRFSLAGVQIKFSMLKKHEHFTLNSNAHLADWIVKTPSIIHPQMPENEYSMMRLAQAVGVNIPEIQLVKLEDLSLPKVNLPHETYAYAIKRFDRDENKKIHMEDFTQIFDVRSSKKYSATNYDSMAKVILNLTKNGQENVVEFIRRIIVNILLANTDAHLKNFTLIYSDERIPVLSPAYDIISSLGYIENNELALNFARIKNFYKIDQNVLLHFANRIGIAEKIILQLAKETIELVHEHWPKLLKELPIPKHLLPLLRQHWQNLSKPLRLVM